MSSRGMTSVLGLVLLLVSGLATQTFAQSPSPSIDVEVLAVKGRVVVAKFVCGTSTAAEELAPGRYFTAINLANSHGGGAPPIILFMDLIQTNGSRRVIQNISLAALPGLSGLEVDCTDVASGFEADLTSGLLKGFVRLVADLPRSAPLTSLEAVAVYTATPAAKQ